MEGPSRQEKPPLVGTDSSGDCLHVSLGSIIECMCRCLVPVYEVGVITVLDVNGTYQFSGYSPIRGKTLLTPREDHLHV
jgi:hypothetical protein